MKILSSILSYEGFPPLFFFLSLPKMGKQKQKVSDCNFTCRSLFCKYSVLSFHILTNMQHQTDFLIDIVFGLHDVFDELFPVILSTGNFKGTKKRSLDTLRGQLDIYIYIYIYRQSRFYFYPHFHVINHNSSAFWQFQCQT